MKRSLFLILLALLLPCLLFGQYKRRPPKPPSGPPTKEEITLAEKHDQCFNSKKYNAQQRRAFFPFNTADTIKLISFEPENEPDQIMIYEAEKNAPVGLPKRDTVNVFTPMARDSYLLNERKVKEIKTLTIKGVDALTNILYNISYTPVKNLGLTIGDPGASCYNPHNAILFVDRKGNITQYLEICFGCKRHYWSSSKAADIEYCNDKYELLRKYFFVQGVKYGADPKTMEN